METKLVRYEAMITAIDACVTVDEVKNIRDKLMALELYARQASNFEAERKAMEIRIRAERRAGEMLNAMAKDKVKGGIAEVAKRLKISRSVLRRWQDMADLPEDKFEGALADPDHKPTSDRVSGKKLKRARVVWSRQYCLYRTMLFFNRCKTLEAPLVDVLAEMTEDRREQCEEFLREMMEWILEYKKVSKRGRVVLAPRAAKEGVSAQA